MSASTASDVPRSPPTPDELERHRAAITGHCYRMLGSIAEAEDAAQEAIVRAWRRLDQYEGRASLRAWLYRIATRVCLDLLEERERRHAHLDAWRRARPFELRPACTTEDPLIALPGGRWVEPIPDALALPRDADPAEALMLRQSIRLAFVAALQHLPPRQRAVLLLTEVLDWSAAEVADSLETTTAAVNSALQRARATLATRDLGVAETGPGPALSARDTSLVDRFVDAFERYDIDALALLLRQDATLSMPPFDLWLQGHEPIRAWLLGHGIGCRGSRLVPTAASGSPAFGQYRPGVAGGPHTPFALIVLETDGARITALNHFLDTATLFPRFGLPPELGG